MNQLDIIVRNRNTYELRKYILERVNFNYTFLSKNYFYTSIKKFYQIKKDVQQIEKKMNIKEINSLIYLILPNLLDHHKQVRTYYNWTCQICHINCLNDKDLLDTHIISWPKDILTNKNILVCCRLCHYNINPKKHFNLKVSTTIKNSILNLRKK